MAKFGEENATRQTPNLTAISQMSLGGQPVAVTASDLIPLPGGECLVYVGTGGDVMVKGSERDVPVLFKNVPNGSILPLRVKYIMATGTVAATDFVAIS